MGAEDTKKYKIGNFGALVFGSNRLKREKVTLTSIFYHLVCYLVLASEFDEI